MKIRRPG